MFNSTKRYHYKTPRFASRFLAWALRFCICLLSATSVTPKLLRELEGRSTFARTLEKFLTTSLWITFQNGDVHFTMGLFKWNSSGMPHSSKAAPFVASCKEFRREKTSRLPDGELPTAFHCLRGNFQKPMLSYLAMFPFHVHSCGCYVCLFAHI